MGPALLAMLASAALAGPVRVAHDGTWQDEAMHWHVEWQGDGLEDRIQFAHPLPKQAEVRGVAVERDGRGRIVALPVSPAATMGAFEVVMPQDPRGKRLAVPLVDDAGVQRVIVDGLRFTPDDDLGLEKHIRYWAPASIDSAGRKAFEKEWRWLGGRAARPNDQAVYLYSEARLAEGIPGRLVAAGHVSWAVHGLLGGVLVGLLVLGGMLYRSLERQEKAEKNAWYIREHLGPGEG